MTEIHFIVEDAQEGGYIARAIGADIFAEGDDAHLQALEDGVWAEKAMEAAKSGFLGSEASMVFLKEMMGKHADTESEPM